MITLTSKVIIGAKHSCMLQRQLNVRMYNVRKDYSGSEHIRIRMLFKYLNITVNNVNSSQFFIAIRDIITLYDDNFNTLVP